MSGLPFKNIYHRRQVADTSQRPCTICYKPTPVVLVSEDGKQDFFYVCQIHLTDKAFAIPVPNQAVEDAKRLKEATEKEIEKFKAEFEEKGKRKKRDREKRDKDVKEKKDSERNAEDDKDDDKKDKKEHNERLRELEIKKEEAIKNSEAQQRVFNLNKDIYSMRLNNWRNVQRSKKTTELLKKPGALPSVPSSTPGLQPGNTGSAAQ
ncbi:VPS4-associated protein 1 [Lipomyces japonicus]|uniref:VPS4-associated protein 1 n=1 Tax=Lipomyces japonicus TaxID=56871 RepID=UPI0034CD99B0